MDRLESLGFLLNRASFALGKKLKEELAKDKIDLPHSQFIVLRVLYLQDQISQKEIATMLCKDPAAIKRTLDNLEHKELIKREVLTQRENSILITNKGRAIMPLALESAERAVTRVVDNIGGENYHLLIELLEKIYTDKN